jgi:hypothetical protein
MKKITSLLMILFSILGFSQDNNGKIQAYLNQNKTKFNLTDQDINDWFVESTGSSESTKIDTYWIKQRYQGIEIYNALSNVWVKNDEIINMLNGFIPNSSQKINTTTPSLSVLNALKKAFDEVNATDINGQIIETISANEFKISNGALTEDYIKAKLVFQPVKNALKLAWDFTFHTQDEKHIWNIKIDAVNGILLEKNDMIISCNFNSKNGCSKNEFSAYKNLFKESNNTFLTQAQGGSYRVIPFNYESPNHSARQLISNPENATASPKGWHDTNSLLGTNASLRYTYLRGNNTWARADYSNSNPVATSTLSTANGYSPINTGLVFDYPYVGTSVAANTYIDAASTNLFYMNNICHDIWYQYGFNEPNGNFQQTNYLSGGTGTDFVWADAQDSSTGASAQFDNANFSAPADNDTTDNNPRMQMYLWSPPSKTYTFLVNSPTTIAGSYDFRQNSFKPGHVDLPIAPAALQSNLVLYDDGTPDPGYTDNADACGAAINASALNGKIVLIRRSLSVASGGAPCSFTVKVKNAQDAGAIGVIIYNNIEVTDTNGTIYQIPIGMSGADATITIPAIGVTKTVGEMLSNSLTSGVTNVKLQLPSDYVPYINADGDFDNMVIAHEFGHGISIRLTGGRNNSSCLGNPEEMGEGWSDWFALMLDMKPGDIGTSPRSVGTFVSGTPTTGDGIRNYPFTTDMSINPETFGYTNGGTAPRFAVTYTDSNGTERVEPHNVGEVWATMLWDLTWAYVNKYGYDDNKYTGTGGNNKVMRLVLDAIKLQPCSPSFVQARDAIIAADQATTGGQNYCMIWQVFARRGLGLNATSGDNSGNATNITAITDQSEDFTEPVAGPNCTLTANYFQDQNMIKVYPNPSKGLYNIHISQFIGKVNIDVIDLNGRAVYTSKNIEFNVDKSIDISAFQTGIYILKVSGDSLNFTQKIMKN